MSLRVPLHPPLLACVSEVGSQQLLQGHAGPPAAIPPALLDVDPNQSHEI